MDLFEKEQEVKRKLNVYSNIQRPGNDILEVNMLDTEPHKPNYDQ